MFIGRFCSSLLISFALAFSATASGASDDAKFGPNLLKTDKNVELYHQNERGVPTYVKGDLSSPVARGAELSTAIQFLEKHRGAFRIENPAQEIVLLREDTDLTGMRHLRLDQYYRGLKVIGGEMVAHFTANGVMRSLNGHTEADLNLDVTPAIAANAATDFAIQDLKSFFGAGNPAEPELVIFPWEGTTYLCYRLFIYSDTPMGRWEYFVDAKTGAVVFKANRIMDVDAVGTGVNVMGQPRNHLDVDFTGSTYQMRNNTRQTANDPHGHDGQMPAGNYLQTNIASSTLPGAIATDADNIWNAGGSQAAAVDGHVYSALVYDWWLHNFGRNSYTNTGTSMLTIVNYSGEGNNNAYWDGSRIVVWSAGSGWRSLAGCPDVIAHEWGHAFTENGSNLVYQKESGALNESFSDMMGAAFEFEFDSLDTPDWLMGENGQTSGAGFRSMSNPPQYGDPEYYGTSDPNWIDVNGCTPSQFNDYCGVHTNSGVGNKWYYLLSDGGTFHSITVSGIGYDAAIKVAARANLFYWTSGITYYNAALATVTAAEDLDSTGAWATQVAKAWNAVGVLIPLASLNFAYPNGVPDLIEPNAPTSFEIQVSGALGGILVPNTVKLVYRVDGGFWTEVATTQVSAGLYEATIPGASCLSVVDFYISAQEQSNGVFSNPSPSSPFSAIVATGSTVPFADNFETNLGWTVSSTATAGIWNRGIPLGGGDRGDPPTDYDGSGQCFVTDRNSGDTDVDGGTTSLTTPVFDLSAGDARISYARWYSNNFGADPNNDVFTVYISNNNGGSWTLVETVGPINEAAGGWVEHSFMASQFVAPTAQMKMRFDAADLNSGSVVEAAIDAFAVNQYECASTALQITSSSLPNWTAGTAYSQQLEAINAVGVLNWTDGNGGLSGTGLSLSSAGVVTGTPIFAGPISFIAQVTDEASAFDNQSISFTVNPALNITTSVLPQWTVGRPYSQTLLVTGGTGAAGWTDKNSNLVGSGLTLSSTGLLSGTPTISGLLNFTARVVDQVGAFAEKPFSVQLNPAVAIVTTSLPTAVQNEAYSQQLTAQDGTGAKTWSDLNNNLSGSGLTLSAAGLLSGTPNTITTLNFTARVVDATGSTDDQALSLVVAAPYVCGDADGSDEVTISDAVFLINYVFGGGPAPDPLLAADADCSLSVNISDAVLLISFIFGGGPAPCASCN
ncbi:MAG: M4 family metallopeptidase [bacterium]|nr:M4 family metallopeptidase [bacterium]